ncbi:MAG: hypothetical protein GF311_17245 [Candidatus Lokiarchaeota archaeon]|nr:hypothetical protein [Candidatus Lokiarchaeota archaeon]
MMHKIKVREKFGRIHSLKDPKLRQIRFQFRRLWFRFYHSKVEECNQKWGDVLEKQYSGELSRDQATRLQWKINSEMENNAHSVNNFPIRCLGCGNKMNDLVFEPKRRAYFCIHCLFYNKREQFLTESEKKQLLKRNPSDDILQ